MTNTFTLRAPLQYPEHTIHTHLTRTRYLGSLLSSITAAAATPKRHYLLLTALSEVLTTLSNGNGGLAEGEEAHACVFIEACCCSIHCLYPCFVITVLSLAPPGGSRFSILACALYGLLLSSWAPCCSLGLLLPGWHMLHLLLLLRLASWGS